MKPITSPAAPANVTAMIWRQARTSPDSPALVTARGVISYRQLSIMTAAIAGRLVQAGVKPGDLVGLSFPQNARHVVAMLAVAHVGAVSVALHPAWSHSMRAATARRFNITQIIAQNESNRVEGIGFELIENLGKLAVMGKAQPLQPVDAAAPFRVAMSSGTTGDPKGVLFSHGYMRLRMQQTGCDLSRSSRLVPGDLNFTIGFVFAMSVLAAGGVLVIPESTKPAILARDVNAYAVSHLFISPSTAQQIARILPGRGVHFPGLQQLRIIGSNPNQTLVDELCTRFSPKVIITYGTTEVGVIAQATPATLQEHPGSAGTVTPWTRVEIVDAAGVAQLPGVVGQIRVATDGMPLGYYLDEDRSKERFRDGWYYTGDLGRIEADGILYVEGRSDNMLNIGGAKVNPDIIERVLEEHPQVQEAIVLSVTPPGSIQQVLVAAVIRREAPPTGLRKFCAEKLGQPLPSRFIVMKEFPRNPNGKVLREQLSNLIGRSLAAQAKKAPAAQKSGSGFD